MHRMIATKVEIGDKSLKIMVLQERIELSTSPLPREAATESPDYYYKDL